MYIIQTVPKMFCTQFPILKTNLNAFAQKRQRNIPQEMVKNV